MTRTAIALATALLFAAPVTAADRIGEPSETRSVEQTVVEQAAKPTKPKTIEGETSDYLVITLKDASIASYDL
jgi:hypothetical protein